MKDKKQMQAAAWSNGGGYYGISITKSDREQYFNQSMKHIDISFCGNPTERFKLTPSFWNKCREIRGLTIRDWFETLGYVNEEGNLPNRDKWPHRHPPKLVLSLNAKGYFDLVPLIP